MGHNNSNTENAYQPGVNKDDMINITSCDFAEFKAYMATQYGDTAFDQGYAIIKDK